MNNNPDPDSSKGGRFAAIYFFLKKCARARSSLLFVSPGIKARRLILARVISSPRMKNSLSHTCSPLSSLHIRDYCWPANNSVSLFIPEGREGRSRRRWPRRRFWRRGEGEERALSTLFAGIADTRAGNAIGAIFQLKYSAWWV